MFSCLESGVICKRPDESNRSDERTDVVICNANHFHPRSLCARHTIWPILKRNAKRRVACHTSRCLIKGVWRWLCESHVIHCHNGGKRVEPVVSTQDTLRKSA